MTTSEIQKFFAPKTHYFVVGASTNPEKIGNKVLKWYVDHNLPVTAVNPNATDKIYGLQPVQSLAQGLKAFTNAKDLNFNASFITPPDVTLREIQMVADNAAVGKLKSLWFQPGSSDADVTSFIECFEFSEKNSNVINDGRCILKVGEAGLEA